MRKHVVERTFIRDVTASDLREAVRRGGLRPDATQRELNHAVKELARAKFGHFETIQYIPIERRAEAGLNPSKKPGAGRRATPGRKYPRRADGRPAPTTYYWDNLGLMRWSDTDGLVRPQNFPEHAEWLKYAKPESEGDECPEC